MTTNEVIFGTERTQKKPHFITADGAESTMQLYITSKIAATTTADIDFYFCSNSYGTARKINNTSYSVITHTI